MFGGCPGAPESHTTGTWCKLANTVVLEMGKGERGGGGRRRELLS